jgi:hypothetical protein
MQATWTSDWIWSLPLILLTMALHVVMLGLIFRLIVGRYAERESSAQSAWLRSSVYVLGFILSAIILHVMECACWGAVYLLLGALPDARQAILYSLNAMTAFGHITFEVADHWKLMGALEALNGILLAGLTTAFTFALLVELNIARERAR